MDTQTLQRRRLPASLLLGVGLASGIALAGFGVASAQSNDSSSGGDTTAAAPPAGGGFGGHRGGRGGIGMGIHGEFTTAAPSGGYQTIATQVGEVTAVSATSVTVKSADGYSRTYTVDDNTLVNAGNEGIADVETGDDVRVTALVVDGKASAVDLSDQTQVSELRGRWKPPRPAKPSDSASPGATASPTA